MSDKDKKNGDSKMEINKAAEQSPTITVPLLCYEMIAYGVNPETPGVPEKIYGQMRLDHADISKVKQQLRSGKDRIVFSIADTDGWPMSVGVDKYSRVWYEEVEQVIAKGKDSAIIDPATGKAAVREKRLILQ